MTVIKFLEQLACTVHHRTDLKGKLNNLPCEVQEAFCTNDATILKAYFNGTKILADRTTIFQ